jgi:hypothetical protein
MNWSRDLPKTGMHRLFICVAVAAWFCRTMPIAVATAILLVNTEAFQTIDDTDTSSNLSLKFGGTLNKNLTYDRTLNRFFFDAPLYVAGDLGVTGTISGAQLRAGNLTVSGALLYTSGSTILGTTKAYSGQVLVGRGTAAPVFRDPTGSLVWYLDSTLSVGTFQGAVVTMPFGFVASSVTLRIKGAPTGAALIADIRKDGTTIFSTRPQINASATTGGASAVFSVTAIPDRAELSLNVDQVGSTFAGSGLTVILTGTRKY